MRSCWPCSATGRGPPIRSLLRGPAAALIARRRQLVEVLVAERNRLGLATQAVRRDDEDGCGEFHGKVSHRLRARQGDLPASGALDDNALVPAA